MSDISRYFSGKQLYGDDFSLEDIRKWYDDEKEGYANLGAKNKGNYTYAYHELNSLHAYKYLKNKKFKNVLGFGSAYGDELLPIINTIERITIIDPSESFENNRIGNIECQYVKPEVTGLLPFESNSYDLITCLGVLHHIPNVSTVIAEMYRCLSNGGALVLREPIISMGDWRKKRWGLTKRERGIPIKIFREIINNAGFSIDKESLCVFPGIPKICNKLGIIAYNSRIITSLDSIICKLFSWNLRYHAESVLQKFRPNAVFYVLQKNQ